MPKLSITHKIRFMTSDVSTFALRLIKQKTYSSFQLRAKLHSKFPEMSQEVESLVDHFCDIDLINDKRLGESIMDVLSNRGYGELKVKEKFFNKQLIYLQGSFRPYEKQSKDKLKQVLLVRFPSLLSLDKIDMKTKYKIMHFIYSRGFKTKLEDIVGENEDFQSNP